MSIIISKAGKNAQRLDRTSIVQEDYLQSYIYANPESLPIDEIREDLKLLILAREFSTGSGPIDALGIDQDGNIYIIETKLYKNPDKRLVLAQALDYGASLWRSYENSEEFFNRLENAVNTTFGVTLNEKIQDFYDAEIDEVKNLLQSVRQNLSDGNFRFVILMDRLEDRLKDLITFVNQNSRFDVFGVELEFYQFQKYEILIPKLYGAEVKKEIVGPKTPSARQSWNETSFFEAAEKHLTPQEIEGLKELYEFSDQHADQLTWGTGAQTGSFNAKLNQINPTKSLYTMNSDGTLCLNFRWLGSEEKTTALVEKLGQKLRQLHGFDMPDNFNEKYINVSVEQWAPQVGAFIAIIQEVLRA